MSKRGENIRKRKDGRWEGRYRKGRNPVGAIQYGSVYGHSYREVKDKLLCVASDAASSAASVKAQPVRFDEILLRWLKSDCIYHKGATVRKYKYLIEAHILPVLGNVPLRNIDASTIRTFMLQKLQCGRLDQKGGLSASYVRSIMLILHAALRFAAGEQLCPPIKAPTCKAPENRKEPAILSLEDQKKLETFLCESNDPTRTGILISLHTGLRIGEICALAWEDIDFHNEIIRVRHTVARVVDTDGISFGNPKYVIDVPKTKSSVRDIPVPSSVLPVLKRMHEQAVSDYVASEKETFVSPRTYEYRYHRLLCECGIVPLNYHALRHTFATRCIEAGVDVKSLSEILGHANVSVTLNTYVHSSMKMKRLQLEKMEAFSAR